ncbi:uncharacterized protein J3R85_017785, partial [Psidium guajava]
VALPNKKSLSLGTSAGIISDGRHRRHGFVAPAPEQQQVPDRRVHPEQQPPSHPGRRPPLPPARRRHLRAEERRLERGLRGRGVGGRGGGGGLRGGGLGGRGELEADAAVLHELVEGGGEEAGEEGEGVAGPRGGLPRRQQEGHLLAPVKRHVHHLFLPLLTSFSHRGFDPQKKMQKLLEGESVCL